MNMQHKGARYLLYGWFSSMRVARVMQAMPSNCTFLEPFMYPRVKKRSISPIPRNNVSGCSSVTCPCYKIHGKQLLFCKLQINFYLRTVKSTYYVQGSQHFITIFISSCVSKSSGENTVPTVFSEVLSSLNANIKRTQKLRFECNGIKGAHTDNVLKSCISTQK